MVLKSMKSSIDDGSMMVIMVYSTGVIVLSTTTPFVTSWIVLAALVMLLLPRIFLELYRVQEIPTRSC